MWYGPRLVERLGRSAKRNTTICMVSLGHDLNNYLHALGHCKGRKEHVEGIQY